MQSSGADNKKLESKREAFSLHSYSYDIQEWLSGVEFRRSWVTGCVRRSRMRGFSEKRRLSPKMGLGVIWRYHSAEFGV